MTDGAGDFEFMQLNQFLDVQPSVEDPLVCHSRSLVIFYYRIKTVIFSRLALTEAEENYGPEIEGSVVVTVYDASTDEPLEEVKHT